MMSSTRHSNNLVKFNPRIISCTDTTTIHREMEIIGVSNEGITRMLPKSQSIVIKLENLTRTQCNVLKQGMLSLGGDTAIHRLVLSEKVKHSSALLIGTPSRFDQLCKKLSGQSFSLPDIADAIKTTLKRFFKNEFSISYPGGKLHLGKKPLMMGILNVTPDSFSNGGKFLAKEDAIAQGLKMAEDGADIIDVGGESTRPGAKPVSIDEELRRVIPVIEKLANQRKLIVSIDTYKSKVAEEAIRAQAKIVNDISGLRADKDMAGIIAQNKVPVIIMHIKGTPKTMQKNPTYEDLMGEIILYLREGIKIATSEGIIEDNIIIDPGIGFGKLPEHNLEILKRLSELKSLGKPIAIGVSRKSFIGHYLNKEVDQRLWGTASAVSIAVARGACILRVHDTKEMSDVINMSSLLR